VSVSHGSQGGVHAGGRRLSHPLATDELLQLGVGEAVCRQRHGGTAVLRQPREVLLDEFGHLGVGPDLAVDPGAFPFCEESNQRILGQLAVLVVFMCRTEVLDDPADSVGVSVPTRGQPDAAALVDALDLAVGPDPELRSAGHLNNPRISGERSVLQRKKFHVKRFRGHESR